MAEVEAWATRDDPPLGVDDAFALVSVGGLYDNADVSNGSRPEPERPREDRGRVHPARGARRVAGAPAAPERSPAAPFGDGAAGRDRERSFGAAWAATLRRAHRAVVAADAEPVAAAAEFIVESHEASLPTARAWRAGDASLLRGPVPLAVLAACGACPADRAGAREGLARALRRRGARVALLEPADFAASGAAGALEAALARLAAPGELGDPRTSAGPLEDLVSWSARTFRVEDDDGDDGDGDGGSGAELVRAPEEAAWRESKRRGPEPDPAGRRTRGADGRAIAPAQRRLRSASASQATGEAIPRVALPPLPVLSVLVEDAEAIDPGALADLVRLLSECRGAAPVALALSLMGSAVALDAMLSCEVLDRTAACVAFSLATPVRRLEAVARRVLLGADGLGPPGGVALGRAPIERLLARFFEHSASVSGMLHGVSVLLARAHARLDAQAAPAVPGCSQADRASFDSRWRRWAIAGLWIARVARAADRGSAWPLWRVLLEFSGDPNRLSGRVGVSDRVASLCASLRRELASAAPEAPRALAADLVAIARSVAPDGLFPTDEAALKLLEIERIASLREEAEVACEAAAPPGPPLEEEEVSSVKPSKRPRAASQTLEMRVRSRTSRAAALRAATEVVACEVLAGGTRPERTPAEELAAAIDRALCDVLATPPTLLHEHRARACVSAEPLDALAASPRDDAHAVLSGRLTGGEVASSGRCDAAVAYELFDSDPSFQNVADWFEAFVSVSGGDPEPEEAAKAGKKRKVGSHPQQPADRVDLAARFTASTAELMLLGLVGPATRRRGDYAHRLAHFPPGIV